MNVRLRPSGLSLIQAVEGIPRLCWIMDETDPIVSAGIITEDAPFEPITYGHR